MIVMSFYINLDESVFSSSKQKLSSSMVENYLKNINFYRYKEGSKKIHLNSEEVVNNQMTGQMITKNPNGVIVEDGDDPLYYSGDSGFFNKSIGQLNLNGNVEIRVNDTIANSERLIYRQSDEIIDLIGNVKTKTNNQNMLYRVLINSDRAKYLKAQGILKYRDNVDGVVQRKRKFELPIFFKSDKLDFFELDMRADLLGNVEITKQQTVATSRRGEIFLENYNKKLKYFALYDDVVVVQDVIPEDGQPPFKRESFSEKLEGYPSENLVVLLGYPKVNQKQDVIKGNIIILRDNNETIEVDNANSNFRLK